MAMRYKVRGCEGLIFGSMCAGWMSSLESDFRKIQLDYAQKKKYIYSTYILLHRYCYFKTNSILKVNLCPIKCPHYTVGERLGENRIFGFPQKYHVKTTQDSTQMTFGCQI